MQQILQKKTQYQKQDHGIGTLTERLLEKAGKVIAVEIDNELSNILKDRFQNHDNFYLINEDILKIDIKGLLKKLKIYTNELKEVENIKVVANIPYYITTDIILKLLNEDIIKEIYIMVQKEVALRMCAKTGSRKAGAITYYIEYRSRC